MSDVARQGVQPGRAGTSRRELAAGAAVGLGMLAGSIVKAAPAQAAQGAAVIEGSDNTGATSRTGVFTTGGKEFGILADPNSSGKGSLGIYGFGGSAGVRGEAPSGGVGVLGITSGAGTGVIGDGGVVGVSGAGTQIGVSGVALAASAVGVVAQSGGPSGLALRCSGRAVFSQSGAASITYPRKSVTVRVSDGLSAQALVLALMQNNVPGVYVVSAEPNSATGEVTISLNKAPGSASQHKTARVAWFAVN